MFKGSFIEVSSVFQEYVRDIARVCQGCFKRVLKVLQGCFEVFFQKVFQECFCLLMLGCITTLAKKTLYLKNFGREKQLSSRFFFRIIFLCSPHYYHGQLFRVCFLLYNILFLCRYFSESTIYRVLKIRGDITVIALVLEGSTKLGKHSKKKVPKSGKSPPGWFGLFWIWEKFEIGKTLNFRNPPSNMEHKLKTLKIA